MWILVCGSDEIIRRPHNGVRTKPGPVLQHHLETTGTAEALYRRRRNGQHTRILDHGKTLTQVGQYCVRVYAGNFMVVERRSEEHTSELQSQSNLVCRLLLEKKKKKQREYIIYSKKIPPDINHEQL